MALSPDIVSAEHEKLLLLGNHAAHLIHDWNNVLTLLQAQCAELPPSDAATDLTASIDEAAALPRQLLSYLRQSAPTRTRIELDEWLPSVEPSLRQLLGRRYRFYPDYGAPALAVSVDTAQLRNALFNLTLNARAALGESGRVRLVTTPHPMGLALALHDNGHGFDDATRARLFEPFFTTRPDSHRTGLGLASVKTFVDAHGGSLSVESKPAEGTVFTLLLPLAP